jgi:hypothetical protein
MRQITSDMNKPSVSPLLIKFADPWKKRQEAGSIVWGIPPRGYSAPSRPRCRRNRRGPRCVLHPGKGGHWYVPSSTQLICNRTAQAQAYSAAQVRKAQTGKSRTSTRQSRCESRGQREPAPISRNMGVTILCNPLTLELGAHRRRL